jgi:hypothetical protein
MRQINPPYTINFQEMHFGHHKLPIGLGISIGSFAWGRAREKSFEVEEPVTESSKLSERFHRSIYNALKRKDLNIIKTDDFIEMGLKVIKNGNPNEVLKATTSILKLVFDDTEFIDLLVKDERILQLKDFLVDSKFVDSSRDESVLRIRTNILCLIGYCILEYTVHDILDNELIKTLEEGTRSDHPNIRGNSFFCIRMGLEANVEIFHEFSNMIGDLLVGTLDDDDYVIQECLLSILLLLEKDVIEEKQVISERRDIFEDLAKSTDPDISSISESILFYLSSDREEFKCNILS